MKNPNLPTNILHWFDIPNVSATIQPHGSVAVRCILKCHGHERADILLMADGMFSLVAHRLRDEENDRDDVFVGLGRVIASHAAVGRQLLEDAALEHELHHVEATGHGPMHLDDLTGVTLTLGAFQPDFMECALRSGAESALVVLVRDQFANFSWVRFSTLRPGRRLLSGLGRMLVAHCAGNGIPAL